jgi:hypothetical protein
MPPLTGVVLHPFTTYAQLDVLLEVSVIAALSFSLY